MPVNTLSETKSRLADVLPPLERAALTLAMLEDVLDATLEISQWESWVISPDELVLEIAARRGARAVPEEEPTLAKAIAQVEAEAMERGAEQLGVLLPDIPLLTTRALTRALHTLGPVVMAPSVDETGTNLLIRRPPTVIHARFGADSYRRHLQSAEEKGIPASVVDIPELAFDVDVPGDILHLLATARRGRTRSVCLELDLGSRVEARAEGG